MKKLKIFSFSVAMCMSLCSAMAASEIKVTANENQLELKAAGVDPLTNARQFLGWRNQGDSAWVEELSSSLITKQLSKNEMSINGKFGSVVSNVVVKRIESNVYEFSGYIRNTSKKTVELARFHYLHGELAPDVNFINCYNLSIAKKNYSSGSKRISSENGWKKWDVNFPNLHDPLHEQPNWYSSTDVGFFSKGFNEEGWFMGFFGQCTAFGEVGFKVKVDPSVFYSGVLLDNIILEPDSSRVLEKMIVYAGDWQDAMAYWVKLAAKERQVKFQTKPLVGYCSWYQKDRKIDFAEIDKATKEFAKMPIPPGGRTIQLDDGFQVMPGDWGPNKKFAKVWKDLPGMISATGSIPGLWLAPTAIYEAHPVAKEHPEMLQQFSKGTQPIYFSNWGWSNDSTWYLKKPGTGKTYFLDPDQPESKKFIRNLLSETVKQGWKYLKLDFTYTLSTARNAYNRKKTKMESLRDLYALFRTSCGPDVLINACIGTPERYALGSVDILRTGGDIGGSWDKVKSVIKSTVARSVTNGYWWQADPDVYFMRPQKNLNPEENFLLTGSIGLMGGLFLTSDCPSQWSAEGRKVVDAFYSKEGPKVPIQQRIVMDDANILKAYLVRYSDENKKSCYRVGVYNWSDNTVSTTLTLKELHLNPKLRYSVKPFFHNQVIKKEDAVIMVDQQPAHSLRIIDIVEE
ncbi:MAG: hypothetical protein WCK78_10710 [Paludibacter sp.]